MDSNMESANILQTAVFGGGCFWCTEAIFKELKGVVSIDSGYSGGTTENPTYETVSTGKTGHAEAIKIEFDPSATSFKELLMVFFATHDPTTYNRQGSDIGTQYRSMILYTSDEQRQEATDFIKVLDEDSEHIVTEVKPFTKFYPAEDYHKNYYEKNKDKPYCQLVISPKLEKLKDKFYKLLKS